MGRHVSRVALNGGLERPFCEAVKVKPELPWRSQDAGDARIVGYILKKNLLTEMKPVQEKEVCCNQQS